jgi:2-keto-4-pentenoate hydratase
MEPYGPHTDLIDAGMRAQLAEAKATRGNIPRVGWKIALNDAGVQRKLGIACSLVGSLASPALERHQPYRPPRNGRPRIEAEIGLRMRNAVGAGASLSEASLAIASISPAIEFVDAAKPMDNLGAMAACSFLHDGVVFGPEYDIGKLTHLGKEFPVVIRDGKPIARPVAGRVPENVGELVVHVARILERYGERLLAGDRIISGSYTDPLDIAPDEHLVVDYGALGKIDLLIGPPR